MAIESLVTTAQGAGFLLFLFIFTVLHVCEEGSVESHEVFYLILKALVWPISAPIVIGIAIGRRIRSQRELDKVPAP